MGIDSPDDGVQIRPILIAGVGQTGSATGRPRSTEEIAQKLHLSAKTVDVHRGHIKEKLAFRSTPEFLRFAIRWVASQARPMPETSPVTPLAKPDSGRR